MSRTLTPAGRAGLAVRGDGDLARLYYVQARLRARLAQRLGVADYERFLRMTLDQVAHALSETAYGEEARQLGLTMAGGTLLREMLRRRLAAEVADLARICGDGALAGWLGAWRWKYDLVLLRAALRARLRSAPMPRGVLGVLAQLPGEVYARLAAVPRLGDALGPLAASPFRANLELAASENPPEQDVLEVGLLHDFYERTLSTLRGAVPAGDPARRLVDNEVHTLNLTVVLAARAELGDEKRTMAQLIPLGFWTSEREVLDLLRAPDGAGLAARLAKLGGGGMLGALELPTGVDPSAGTLERAAARAALREVGRAARWHRPTPAAVLGYLTLLETEARNVLALVLAAEGGVDRDRTRSMLVA